MESKKVARASTTYTMVQGTNRIPGWANDVAYQTRPYHEVIKLCRYFYRTDPIASTVLNRISEIASTPLRNRRRSLLQNGVVAEEEYNFYNAIAALIQPYISTIMLTYMLDGMAIPQYELTKMAGNRVNLKLGRTRYSFPHAIWLRDAENIVLYRTVKGHGRRAMIKVPIEDINFIQTRGQRSDGTVDREAYDQLVAEFPDYVAAIDNGATVFPVDDYIIYRKLLPQNDYPIPFLEPALNPLDHKRYIKLMDRSVASRAIEAFRHVKVGSDEYPADDEDIEAAKTAMGQNSSADRVYNLFTNHTISIEWVTPPIEVLLDNSKYDAANNDIFFALGFPRILTVGETEKSNSADNKIAALGVLSTLKDVQKDVLEWVKHLYRQLAEANGFTKIPDPYFSAIPLADVTQLIQYASDLLDRGVISKDTASSFYGTDFEAESDQVTYESENTIAPGSPNTPINNNNPQVPNERVAPVLDIEESE